MRIIARFSKLSETRFVSHLDIQRLFGRVFRRAGIPVAYSQGFNPHPVLSFATALSTGVTSSAEWLDVRLDAPVECSAFIRELNASLPSGFRVTEAYEADDKLPALTALLKSADYSVVFDGNTEAARLSDALERLLSGPINIMKRTKSGVKPFDMRPQVKNAHISEENGFTVLHVEGILDATGSLNADSFTKELLKTAEIDADYSINRDAVYFENGTQKPF